MMGDDESTDAHFDPIYSRHAGEYHELVTREDTQGNLVSALRQIVDFNSKTVVELGAGTGRITKIIAPMSGSVLAFDRSGHMLEQAAAYLSDELGRNVTLAEADNRRVPLPDAAADIVIEGWSFGHTVMLGGDAWKAAAEGLLAETTRLLKRGGTAILIETLGTGFRAPQPPGPVLPLFFSWLEEVQGYARKWIRTDYTFESQERARTLVEFFFGQMVEHEVLASGAVTVPECTGIWWKRKQE
jgi:ubiquinone/menaquinone biosynthesis C-methylase UbiE